MNRWDAVGGAGASMLGGGVWAVVGPGWAFILGGVLLLALYVVHEVRG